MGDSLMRRSFAFLLCALGLSLNCSNAGSSELDLREFRLLKSWGLQADSKGRLYYRPGRDRDATTASNWQPDLSSYRSRPVIQIGETLKPVVISAKQK